MSFILDALRKSDQQRQHGATPTLMSVQFPVQETRRHQVVRIAALATTLLVVGILIGWWRPWQAEAPRAAAPVPASADAAASGPHDVGKQTEASPDLNRQMKYPPAVLAAPAEAVAPAAPAISRGAVVPPVAAVTADKLPPATAKPAAVPEPPAAAAKPAAPPPVVVAADPRLATRAELPPAIQQEIPTMTVSLHAYSSKPKNRLVSVNDRLLHEGEALAPGLILEQITPDGMIFGYKGFRFRQGVR